MNTVKKLVVDVLVEEYAKCDMLHELRNNPLFKRAQAHEDKEIDPTKARNIVWTIEDEVNWEMCNW